MVSDSTLTDCCKQRSHRTGFGLDKVKEKTTTVNNHSFRSDCHAIWLFGPAVDQVRASAGGGATVNIADLNEEAANRTAQEVGDHAYVLDVTNREQVRNVVSQINEKYGGIDILCANAGIFPQANLEDITDEQWDQMLTVNTKSTFITVQEVLKFMKPARYGRIVITTSITGSHTGYPG